MPQKCDMINERKAHLQTLRSFVFWAFSPLIYEFYTLSSYDQHIRGICIRKISKIQVSCHWINVNDQLFFPFVHRGGEEQR